MERLDADAGAPSRSAAWKWYICGLLLLATMLNYMDRQTLSLTAKNIKDELQLSSEQYGELELGFGLAFAVGAVLTGFLADKISVRWLYPLVLLGWSAAGFATSYAEVIGEWLVRVGFIEQNASAFRGLLICRVVLGLFEAGQWPCALVTSQRLLPREDRTLGNSILQSGASLGAIFTPVVVQLLVSESIPGSWRIPYQVIGLLGMLWIIPWLIMIRERDLATKPADVGSEVAGAPGQSLEIVQTLPQSAFLRRYLVLAVVVTMINMPWHFFRAWLPLFLREQHAYSATEVNWFVSAYFISTDVGCIAVGFAVKWLAGRGWNVHRARMTTFFLCACLTALSTVAARLPAGPVLLCVLLLIGFGALGLFPNYYSFAQELTSKHQGKVTGTLSCITWIFTAAMHPLVGRSVDATKSYAMGLSIVGWMPLIAFVALCLFWRETERDAT